MGSMRSEAIPGSADIAALVKNRCGIDVMDGV